MKNINNLSVVVPTFNEESMIDSFMKSMISQDLAPRELLIIDGGSSDGTIPRALTYKKQLHEKGTNLIIRHLKKRGITLARDTGFLLASSQYIASCDVDTLYPSEYLKVGVSWLEARKQQNIVGVGGNPVAIYNPPWFMIIERKLMYAREYLSFEVFKTIIYIRAHNIVFIRQAYLESSRMDTSIYAIEDEIGLSRSLREIGKIDFCPDLKPLSSNRSMNRGLLNYLFKTILLRYWGGYFLNRVFRKNYIYQRLD